MIKIATKDDYLHVALMLHRMTEELFPEYAASDLMLYLQEVLKKVDDGDTIFVDSMYRGFFIVHDDSTPITPSMKRYAGTYVYIAPEHRKSRLLSEFYDTLFKTFPDGEILGATEISSAHIKVLDKRHRHIMNVYSLNRNGNG